MSQPTKTPPYTMERATFSARETELVWTFRFGFDAVWEAVNSAATRTGLTLISMDRQVGMSVAKPPFSLFNFGRRIVVTFLRQGEKATQVRAVYLHGVSLLGRHSRQETLEALLRTALGKLDRPEPKPKPTPQAEPASDAGLKPQAAAPSGAPPRQDKSPGPEAAPSGPARPGPEPASPERQPAGQAAPQGETSQRPATAQAATETPRPGQGPNLASMDFRHVDLESLPLTPPTGAEAMKYRLRPPLQRSSGFGRTAGWFILGLLLAVLAFILSGGLSLIFKP